MPKTRRLIGLIAFVFLNVLLIGRTSALSGSKAIDKAYLEGLYNCYTNGHMYAGVGSQRPITMDDFPVFSPLTADATSHSSFIIVNDSDGLVLLPTGLTKITDNDLKCDELFVGYKGTGGQFDGLFKLNGVTRPGKESTPEVKAAFLKNLGYTESSENETSGNCSAINFTKKEFINTENFSGSNYFSTDGRSISLCSEGLNDNKITSNTKLSTSANGGNNGFLSISVSNDTDFTVSFTYIKQEYNGYSESYEYEPHKGTISDSIKNYSGKDWADFVRESILNKLVEYDRPDKKTYLGGYQVVGGGGDTATIYTLYFLHLGSDAFTTSPTASVKKVFSITNFTTAAETAIRYFSGTDDISKYSDLEYTDAQKVSLYQAYLTDSFEIEYYDNTCNAVTDQEAETIILNGFYKVKWYMGEGLKTKTCFIKSAKELTLKKVYGIKANKHFGEPIVSDDNTNTAMKKIIDILNSTTLSEDDDPPEPVDPDPQTTKPTCANSGGAMSLGWIVCPLLTWVGKATEGAYTKLVEPSLYISPKLFSQDENTGTRNAWGVFQGFANSIFIILFLIVIFSQLTGVGIDNYGIKKILPKLILVAVLVNLSYYICLIFVDLSNILGNGLKGLFDNLSTGTPTLTIPDSDLVNKTISSTTITFVAVLLAMVGMVGAVWQNPAIVLSLLVSALGVGIAIFFLFILLATREAAIVALIVISPVAFVCYALPNTKKLFDKWLNAGKGLLLVYPICGLLVGGGNYVSRLLLSTGMAENGFVAAFTAMIVGIVPVFFIPSVLKGSFAALGNLGAKISGFGDKLRGGATRGIRNMEGYKNAQKMGLERRTRLKAGLDKNGNLTARGERRARRANTAFGRFIGSDKRRAAYIAQAKKDIGTSEEAGAMLTGALARSGISQADALPDSGAGGELGPTFAAGTESAYYGGQFFEAARSGNITGMNAAINAMRASGMKAKDIAKILRYAQNNGYFNGIDQNTRAAWMRDVAKKYGSDFLSTDFELSHFMTTGGSGNGGILGNYGQYASTNMFGIDDVKPEDVLKLSGDSLAGMISAGKIDRSMAQRVMAMNPNLSADKKVMLGAVASGIATGGTGGSITSANDFKEEAKQLMNNPSATSWTDASGATRTFTNIVGANKDMVQAWTSAAPQEVNVVQNFQGGGKQYQPVDMQEAGMYADPAGNVYRIRRTQDGKHIDDAGFEVDISKFHPR